MQGSKSIDKLPHKVLLYEKALGKILKAFFLFYGHLRGGGMRRMGLGSTLGGVEESAAVAP